MKDKRRLAWLLIASLPNHRSAALTDKFETRREADTWIADSAYVNEIACKLLSGDYKVENSVFRIIDAKKNGLRELLIQLYAPDNNRELAHAQECIRDWFITALHAYVMLRVRAQVSHLNSAIKHEFCRAKKQAVIFRGILIMCNIIDAVESIIVSHTILWSKWWFLSDDARIVKYIWGCSNRAWFVDNKGNKKNITVLHNVYTFMYD